MLTSKATLKSVLSDFDNKNARCPKNVNYVHTLLLKRKVATRVLFLNV
jgi:hypothetical protein